MDLDIDYYPDDHYEDDQDSDAIDPEIEEKLYAQIYHQSNDDDTTSSRLESEPPLSVTGVGIKLTANLIWEIKPTGNAVIMSLNNDEVITIGSDSDEDNQCSKSMVAGKIIKPADLLDQSTDSDSSLLDLSSDSCSNSPIPIVDSVFRLANVTGLDTQNMECSTEEEDESDDDIQIIDDDDSDQEEVVKRPSTKSVLKSFLGKCKPSYTPSGDEKSKSLGKQLVEKKLKKVMTNNSNNRVKEVTLDLLNSLPGSNNRFKRMRMDPGESSDLWKLDSEDMKSNTNKRLAKARYYRQHRCNHCRDFTSHTTERCPFPKPEPVCSMCGIEGHHENYCDDVICSKCFKTGHQAYNCSFNFKNVSCNLCSLIGHKEQNCSNHWRRFHSTTHVEEVHSKKVRRNLSKIWCGNCGRRGHFAHECHQLYSNKSFWPSSPFLEPSSAMFNIKKSFSSPKSSSKRSQNETVTTPAKFNKNNKNKTPDTPAAFDSLPNLFNEYGSKQGSKVKRKSNNKASTSVSSSMNDNGSRKNKSTSSSKKSSKSKKSTASKTASKNTNKQNKKRNRSQNASTSSTPNSKNKKRMRLKT